jgi:DNA-binding HxlR family transcriptional regulator
MSSARGGIFGRAFVLLAEDAHWDWSEFVHREIWASLPPVLGQASIENETTDVLAEVLGALGHPVRVRVIRHFDENVKLSPSRLQEAMPDVSLGTLAYHVRQLAGAGLLQRAGRIPRRGAVEHLYLLTSTGATMAAVLDDLLERF